MKDTKRIFVRAIILLALLSVAVGIRAAEVVYRIVEYNKTTGEFDLAASGKVPQGAWAYFENDYGSTTGNRYNQIPRNKKATFFLEGWQGCTVKKITFSMCSNNKSGQVGFSVVDGDKILYTMRPDDFASDAWFGEWVSKDFNVYVDIDKLLDVPAFTSNEASITLQGGTSEGSVYIDAIAIEYDGAPGTALESPLGWSYEKLTKKSTLAEGDEVMIYRNGCAAADYDGMETSGYLDVVALASTADVTSPDMLRFKLNKADGQNMWTMTDQYGRKLGATGKQKLAWNDGNTLWSIALGYDGATITNGKTDNGSLRYNAPEGSYARFNVYTSNSLPLPFLYRRDKQKSEVMSQSLTFADADITVELDKAHIVLAPTLLPAATTDRRIVWTSSNESVAKVNGGFVTLLSAGETTITAKAKDGGAESSVHLTVAEPSAVNSVKSDGKQPNVVRKVAKNNSVIITVQGKVYGIDGSQVRVY